MRTITTCAGIGDSIWLFQKLINQKEKFDFLLPDTEPQRGHQIFELMPQIFNSVTYTNMGESPYSKIKAGNHGHGRWSDISKQMFYLSANNHLERGKRIETFLPDLKTSFKLDYATTEQDKAIADGILPTGTKYIGLYTSAYSNTRNWNMWGAGEWFALCKRLRRPNITFVIIGASYDVGVIEDLITLMNDAGIKYINTTGQPLSVVIEILKKLFYFIGFPSGLSILNETLGKDGMMFYAEKVKGIMNTWADPVRIKNGNIKECLQDTPAVIFEWLRSSYQIFDRL